MAHDHGAPRELHQRVLQGTERVDVQVVRRFVQQQQVRAAAQQAGQMDAVPLAARERSRRPLLIGAAEIEPRDVGT